MVQGINIQRALVVGLGFRTGVATSNFLAKRGSIVVASDAKSEEQLEEVRAMLDDRVRVVSGEQKPALLNDEFDTVVLSPGVPATIPLIREARRRGIPVISEIELAYRYCRGEIIAITGTDGKSTTTALTGHILKQCGIDTFVGGNIGIPFISFVEKTTDSSVSVLELSSFQLETVERFRPDVAALLNLSCDHLDRYDSIDDYFQAKMRISMNQTEDNFLIYNRDDRLIAQGLNEIRAQKRSFSLSPGADAFFDNGEIRFRGRNGFAIIDSGKMKIIGVHNILNTMAGVLLTLAVLDKMGIEPDFPAIEKACHSFRGLPHRMEVVGEFQGRTFINDSKATTVSAVEMALKSLTGNVVLILGGRTKGDDYARLRQSIRERVILLILIGESSADFERLFADCNPVRAETLENAVRTAMRMSTPGDTVLLSPACASFDMFRSYEERGDVFRDHVHQLMRGELQWT